MVPPLLDPHLDAHAVGRLAREPVVWLQTVAATGHPHAVPVWFVWHDPVVTLFSRPDTAKVGHLRRSGVAGIALDTASSGTDVVTGHGDAALVGDDAVAAALPDFAVKYAPLLGDRSLEQWREVFSLPVVVTVRRLVTWRYTDGGLAHRTLRSA